MPMTHAFQLRCLAVLLASLTFCSCRATYQERSAARGALIGAGAGALIGAASGNAGKGALIGAAAGGLAGSVHGHRRVHHHRRSYHPGFGTSYYSPYTRPVYLHPAYSYPSAFRPYRSYGSYGPFGPYPSYGFYY